MAKHVRRSNEQESELVNGSLPGIHVTTAEEGYALFDRQARKALGISGREFLKRWDSGFYASVQDDPGGRKVRRLAMLIPFARRAKA